MPNWCSNRLSVEGAADALTRWSTDVAGTDNGGRPVPLDFERVLPTPRELGIGRVPSPTAAELIRLYLLADPLERQRLARAQPLVAQMAIDVALGAAVEDVAVWDAGDWRTHHWGTPSRIVAESVRMDDETPAGTVRMLFSTAWSPPRPLVMELIQRYRDLSFDLVYSEPDDGFAGRLVGTRGEVVLDTETREPDEAIELLSEAGWSYACDDWRDPVDEGG